MFGIYDIKHRYGRSFLFALIYLSKKKFLFALVSNFEVIALC